MHRNHSQKTHQHPRRGRGFGPDGQEGFGTGRTPRGFGARAEGFGPGNERGGFGPGGFGPGGPRGFGPGGEMGFGPGRPGMRGGPRGRGGRRGSRRGEVRNAILALLNEGPMNGYQLISAIEERSNGLWRPSAGSVYPALGLLEDEGLIARVQAESGAETGKAFELTEAGRQHVAERGDELSDPWSKVAEPFQGYLDVRGEMHQLGMALHQVVMAGDPTQVSAAKEILDGTRKALYRVLAGDTESSPSADTADHSDNAS